MHILTSLNVTFLDDGNFQDLTKTPGDRLCEGLPCSDPNSQHHVIPTLSLESTKCARGKVCHLGACVTPEASDHVTIALDDEGKVLLDIAVYNHVKANLFDQILS